MISRRQDEDDKTIERRHLPHAWFVAYAPAHRPALAVAVLVEHGEHGSSTAAPVARRLIEAYMQRVHPAGLLGDHGDKTVQEGER